MNKVWWLSGFLCSLLWAGQVSAHARLVQSSPPAEALLSRSPTAITLSFNEEPESEFSSIQVLDSTGKVVAEGKLVASEPRQLLLPIAAALPAGNYAVRYRVLSVDGHTLSGHFSFRVGAIDSP